MAKCIAIIGPGESMPGGMLEVEHQILRAEMPLIDERRILVATASNKLKFATFGIGFLRLLFLCITKRLALAHINMSERGSVTRTQIMLKLFSSFNVKTIIHSHGGEIEKDYYKKTEMEKMHFSNIMSKADAFIVLTEGWKQFWKQIVPGERIIVLPNAVQLPSDNRKEYMANGVINILFMGYIGKVKGTYDLIAAASILKKKDIRFHLTIAGNGEIETCKTEIEKNNLTEDTEVTGWISGQRKEEILRNSDVFVLPSHYESFGIAALEAMARKLPVICGDKGYTKEVIQDGVTGYVAQTGNPDDIADKIMKLADRDKLQIYGEKGYERVKEHYQLENIMNRLEKIYYDLLTVS